MSGRFTEDVSCRRPDTFVSCRVGLEFKQFELDLKKRLLKYNIGEDVTNSHGDFIITPIASTNSIDYNQLDDIKVLSDLKLPQHEWESKVAVSISYEPYADFGSDTKAEEVFRTFLEHALYLPTHAVIIDCPKCPKIQKIIARIVNEKMKRKAGKPLILFRVHLGFANANSEEEQKNLGIKRRKDESTVEQTSPEKSDDSSVESGYYYDSPIASINQSTKPTDTSETILGYKSGVFIDDWSRWNALRQHLEPDIRIGVCLSISRDFADYGPFKRWVGEPIRIITLSCDKFVSNDGCKSSTRLVGRLTDFLGAILLANSFMTAFVVQAIPGQDLGPYLRCLSQISAKFNTMNPDPLRGWNDNLMKPLQPLSTNLDATTYQVFELDNAKYEKYQEAMAEALDFLMMKPESRERDSYNLMVLGAGRGPLVDAMIRAILSLKLDKKFKIYALDKNYSSVQALREKQAEQWSKTSKNITTEVVRADMRFWQPKEKADLIATELLGSFSDNELSPECIDGTWRFSSPSTISIPESYTSYIAPICSFRMHQELNIKHNNFDRPFDQIYVVRLSNIYTISEPQPLFTFEHLNLSKEPIQGANQRQKQLVFSTLVDTVCHGFAGYFVAKLFGGSFISTVPSFKTKSMDSWFPAYIPLEKPVQMAANTQIELSFSRKENDTHVWYEWAVTRPEVSRIHSQAGEISAMSKII